MKLKKIKCTPIKPEKIRFQFSKLISQLCYTTLNFSLCQIYSLKKKVADIIAFSLIL